MTEQKEPQESPETEPTRLKRIVHFVLQKKIAIPLIVVTLLTSAPLMYRNYRINLLPHIDHPFDLEEFLSLEIPDEENAYVEYKQAVNRLVPFKGAWDEKVHNQMEQHGWSKSTPAFQNWIEDNQPALAIWKEGTKKPDAQFMLYRKMTLENDFTISSEIRDLIRLIHFQIMKLQHENKYAEAWEWNRALFRFSRHVGKNGMLIERLIGITALHISQNAIRKWVQNPAVDAVMLQKALKQIETDYDMKSNSPLKNSA